MKKTCIVAIIFTLIIYASINCFSVSSANTINISYNTTSSTLSEYVKNLRILDNDIYILGKAVFTNLSENKEMGSNIQKDIDFTMEKLKTIKNSLLSYSKTIKNDNLEIRNTTSLIIAANYYYLALEELNFILDNYKDSDIYDASANFFL
ncbi:hypothetical protein ANS017_08840 [Paraclostridium bifermentans]|uniref:hypothetical protein n=1 Tax=Paraclostridium bifermentans TaxID=1490 RepID=UPI0021C46107|nr:hypothetical protein [Paraclostridium bifermentans]GKZ02308.1 hypothetical protein ANS014_07420 [Paraclostridium bifermentans]GKZ05467.1 hypothetical protein ANS015_03500 [Paraclostridium bifermentans]GKZ09500.1 hypothetical protein ANS017_08840 [Paraclostridium bifermentans]